MKRRQICGQCWIWAGPKTRDGYGVMSIGRGKQHRVHRVSYEHFCGPIPVGKLVCHHCDTPLCFNPEHLFLGSPRDNTADMHRKGRRVVNRGDAHHNTKITESQRVEIRQRRQNGETLAQLARDYGVVFQSISRIVHMEK